jgi:hypothetical protein
LVSDDRSPATESSGPLRPEFPEPDHFGTGTVTRGVSASEDRKSTTESPELPEIDEAKQKQEKQEKELKIGIARLRKPKEETTQQTSACEIPDKDHS